MRAKFIRLSQPTGYMTQAKPGGWGLHRPVQVRRICQIGLVHSHSHPLLFFLTCLLSMFVGVWMYACHTAHMWSQRTACGVGSLLPSEAWWAMSSVYYPFTYYLSSEYSFTVYSSNTLGWGWGRSPSSKEKVEYTIAVRMSPLLCRWVL